MKKMAHIAMAISILAFCSASLANPKCSHRVASNGNDLFKNTNPIKVVAAKDAGTKSKNGRDTTTSGVR